MDVFHAILLGVVEGLTEFLPVSSTAHLMLTARILGKPPDEFLKTFEIAIQPGAILAVLVLYWRKLLVEWETIKRVAVAFVPTAVLGLLCYKTIKSVLLESHYIALAALAVGGVVMIVFEKFHREKPDAAEEMAQISYVHCIILGCCQALAFVPGVSRSAATILGGLILGWKRRTAVEFSFLLAVPTMTAATAFDLYKSGGTVEGPNFLLLLAVGFFVSFVVALLAIRFLLRFIRNHTFVSFGIYRIFFAVLVFLWMIFTGGANISDSSK